MSKKIQFGYTGSKRFNVFADSKWCSCKKQDLMCMADKNTKCYPIKVVIEFIKKIPTK